MSLDADYVVERHSLKRRLLVWRIVALAVIAGAAIASLADVGDIAEGDHIARLQVSGVIVDDLDREQALGNIKDDDRVVALIVRIDSPGGTVVGGENLFSQLRAISDRKPVVAVMGSMATSAGYMAALGADYLIARDGSLTGSIGVLLQTADITGLLEKIGVKPETVKSGPLKAQPNPFEATTPEARKAVEGVVMDMYAMFVDMVAQRRELDPATVGTLADGRVFTGRQARENGLIDAIGSETEAIGWLEKSREITAGLPVRDVIIERRQQAWWDFINGLAGKVLFSERLRLDGLVSLWQPDRW